MTELGAAEYAALRETIRSRGNLRPSVFLAGLSGWAVALLGVLIWVPNPVASAIPLVLLLATFEVVRSLHLGVERIGRYIQVYFEALPAGRTAGPPSTPPRWEHAAMALGPSLPGAGGHPLYLPIFVIATALNFFAVLFPGPLPVELATLAVPHLALVFWLVHCDRGMRRQRTTDLARFRAMRDENQLPTQHRPAGSDDAALRSP